MIEAEGVLLQIALEVLFTAVLIHACHTALEHAEEAFNCVRGHVTSGVLSGAVVDRLMLGELFAQFVVQRAFVRVQTALRNGAGPQPPAFLLYGHPVPKTSATFFRTISV